MNKKQLADDEDIDAHLSKMAQQSLASFPATDQPASESTIKEMLLSLKSDLKAELGKNLANLQSHIEHTEERVDNLEKIGRACRGL